MKKVLAILSLAAVVGASQAVVIFDNLSGATGYTTSSSQPGFLMGDGATAIASPGGAGWHWRFTSIDYGFFVIGAQSFTSGQLGVRIRLYDGYTDIRSGASLVYGNLMATVTANYGAFSTTGNAAYNSTISLGAGFDAPQGMTTLGYTVEFFNTGVRTQTVRAAFGNPLNSTVGWSPHGFYRDADDNGITTGSDWRQFSATENNNMLIRFNGDPVPEPASLAVLGLGALALIRRRK